MRTIVAMISAVLFSTIGYAQTVRDLEVTVLSTMVANFTGEGEWGFAALVKIDAGQLLFDTGFKPNTVLRNAEALGVDLSGVENVVISHYHSDHTGGLLTLRRAFMKANPRALSKVYVGTGFFEQRYRKDGIKVFIGEYATPGQFRSAAEALGITFEVVSKPLELLPGITITGPVERVHEENNVSPGAFLDADAKQADYIPESQGLGIATEHGWLLISGCGHAGIVNFSEKLQSLEDIKIFMGIGGFHLFQADQQTIDWTALKMRSFGYRRFVGAHCTGAYATHEIARQLQISREHVSIGAVGTRIDADLKIHRASIE